MKPSFFHYSVESIRVGIAVLLSSGLLFVTPWANTASNDVTYIERPYGPAARDSLLEMSLATDFIHGNGYSRSSQLYWLGAEYTRGINEEFALIWSPLPLGLIIKDESEKGLYQSGGTWNLDLSHRGVLGAKPRFEGFLRRPLAAKQAVEVDLEYFAFFPFNSDPNTWTLSLGSSYVLQLNRSLAIAPGLAIVFNDNVLLSGYSPNSSHDSRFKLTVPASFLVDVRVSRNAHVTADYTFRGVGLNQAYFTHAINLGTAIRW